MALEVLEHLATRHLEVDVVSRFIEVNFGPLIYALAHLLAQCAQHDIVHWRKNAALALSSPAILHRDKIEIDAFGHEVVEQVPLRLIPIGKELMPEHVDRMTLLVEVVAEAHIDYSFLTTSSLASIDGMIGGDVELWRPVTRNNETSTSLGVDCQVSSNGKIEAFKVEVDVHIIKKDVSSSQGYIGINEVIIIFGVSPVDGRLLDHLRDGGSHKRLTSSSVGLPNIAKLTVHGDHCLELCLVLVVAQQVSNGSNLIQQVLIIFLLLKRRYLALVSPKITYIAKELEEIALGASSGWHDLESFLRGIVNVVDDGNASKLVLDDLVGPNLAKNGSVPLYSVARHREHAILEIEVLEIRTEIVEIVINALKSLKLIIAKVGGQSSREVIANIGILSGLKDVSPHKLADFYRRTWVNHTILDTNKVVSPFVQVGSMNAVETSFVYKLQGFVSVERHRLLPGVLIG